MQSGRQSLLATGDHHNAVTWRPGAAWRLWQGQDEMLQSGNKAQNQHKTDSRQPFAKRYNTRFRIFVRHRHAETITRKPVIMSVKMTFITRVAVRTG